MSSPSSLSAPMPRSSANKKDLPTPVPDDDDNADGEGFWDEESQNVTLEELARRDRLDSANVSPADVAAEPSKKKVPLVLKTSSSSSMSAPTSTSATAAAAQNASEAEWWSERKQKGWQWAKGGGVANSAIELAPFVYIKPGFTKKTAQVGVSMFTSLAEAINSEKDPLEGAPGRIGVGGSSNSRHSHASSPSSASSASTDRLRLSLLERASMLGLTDIYSRIERLSTCKSTSPSSSLSSSSSSSSSPPPLLTTLDVLEGARLEVLAAEEKQRSLLTAFQPRESRRTSSIAAPLPPTSSEAAAAEAAVKEISGKKKASKQPQQKKEALTASLRSSKAGSSGSPRKRFKTSPSSSESEALENRGGGKGEGVAEATPGSSDVAEHGVDGENAAQDFISGGEGGGEGGVTEEVSEVEVDSADDSSSASESEWVVAGDSDEEGIESVYPRIGTRMCKLRSAERRTEGGKEGDDGWMKGEVIGYKDAPSSSSSTERGPRWMIRWDDLVGRARREVVTEADAVLFASNATAPDSDSKDDTHARNEEEGEEEEEEEEEEEGEGEGPPPSTQQSSPPPQ